MRPARVWLVLALLYAAFFAWYTSFGGPLTDEEIEHYLSLLQERGTPPEGLLRIRTFLEEDTGDDFAMVNVIHFRDPPGEVDGVSADSAEEMIAHYMEYMWPALLRRACHPVLFGQAAGRAMDVVGLQGVDDWSQAGIMRYRSRRDLMEIATNPEFAGRHEYKVAALEKTIAYPIDPWFHLGDPRLLLALLFLVIGLAAEVRSRRA